MITSRSRNGWLHQTFFLANRYLHPHINQTLLKTNYRAAGPRIRTPFYYQPQKNFTATRIYRQAHNHSNIAEMVAELTPTQKKSLQRFVSGGMSFGSISYEAHTTIASAMNQIAMAIHHVKTIEELKKLPHPSGPMSNSGEGGELETRNNTLLQSRIRQVASGRFGVNIAYLANASELQIKINQGAKPGIGGELPAKKVNTLIAKTRLTEPGITLSSPPPHHDIYSIEDLKQLIFDLRSANPVATISVKLAASDGIGVIAAGVAKCGADNISIAGPGSSGATPLAAKFEFVHPWETSLAEVHQTLTAEGLRSSVTLTVSGGLQTGLDYFKALLLGADLIEGGTSVLVSLGCVMAEVCHDGTCPTGIATTNQEIIDKKFNGKPENVARLLIESAKSLTSYLEKYGFTDPSQAVGRTDLLQVKDNAPLTQLQTLLHRPTNYYFSFGKLPKESGSSYAEKMGISRILQGEQYIELPASNRDLSFGARIGYSTTLQDFKNAFSKPVTFVFKGLAVGQSFGFVAPTNLILIANNSNDGTGKSLDGANLYIRQAIGNQAAFGATRGTLMARFIGDRAAVRNSGAHIVTESLGQMAANFMTGGSLTILGTPDYYDTIKFTVTYTPPVLFREDVVGPNLGAGFSGGKIFMPKKLYAELDASQYLAPHARYIQPQTLSDEDGQQLTKNLQQYTENIPSPWVIELLSQAASLKKEFIKLDPKVEKSAAEKSAATPLTQPRKKISLPSVDAISEELSRTENKKTNIPSPVIGTPKGNNVIIPERDQAAAPSSLYDPSRQKDACGTGTLVRLDGKPSKEVTTKVLIMLSRFMHRGSVGVDPKTGDGCGISWYGLDEFFQKQFPENILKKNSYSIVPIILNDEEQEKNKAITLFQQLLAQENLSVAGTRDVEKNSDLLGYLGQQQERLLRQFLILKPDNVSEEAFEKSLIRTRLRFELSVQNDTYKVRPHIYSASAYYVIYKSLVKEDKFSEYFVDFSHPDFKASAGVSHSRFATNTLPMIKNIQPLSKVANNGENNSLQLITRLLTHDPLLRELLSVEAINLKGFSDSHIMSIYMDMLHLLNFSAEEIVASTIHPYNPKNPIASHFYNLFAIPFEGPNASLVMMGNKIIIVRDINGFRPQRGVVNDTFLYSGSELGTVDMTGDVFDLPPGKPLIIDLSKGTAALYEQDKIVDQKQLSQLHYLEAHYSESISREPIIFSQEELTLRQLRAGWNDEFDKMIMEPLYNRGQGSTSSMADQGPIEALVSGSYFSLGNFFKGNFSQITNPALAKKEEEAYMSTLTFVGHKPSLSEINESLINGIILPSPIVDNLEMAYLQAHGSLKTKVVDITFIEYTREDGLKTAIQRVTDECIQHVLDGTTVLVLSDIQSSDKYVAIPPVLISSIIDKTLLERGIRRHASIALQVGNLLAGRDIAQAISIGGADIINPYLAFIASKDRPFSPTEFKNRCEAYKESLRQELLGFMARMGISTVSAYRGTKGFNAYGLSTEVAALYGVPSRLGGLDIQGVTQILRYNHNVLKKEGIGKYLWQGQEPRKKIWHAGVTNTAIQIAKGDLKKHAEMEDSANQLKRGSPRGWLRLVKPQVWNHENPMTVCIMGGGAAGFYQARSLLDSKLPINIVIIEQKHGNKFGLVGDGVAPDHESTKNQALLLQECLRDERVKYFGGVEIGKDVTYEQLTAIYPCVVDCRGATEDIRLGVAGEDLPSVLNASSVYKAYNREFNPFNKNKWPLIVKSKNPAVGIIGNGNVTADLARMFLKNPDELESTSVNPLFLSYLREEGPDIVRIFARGNPIDSKIGLKELNELKKLGIWMSSSFDPKGMPLANLTDHQKKLYDFFLEIRDKKLPMHHVKRLYFHFQLNIKEFRQNGTETEVEFTNRDGVSYTFRSKNFIVAIGRRPLSNVERPPYISGWAVGKGGTLRAAEDSANQTTQQIKEDFHKGKFHNCMEPPKEQSWQLNAVGKKEFLSILAWLQSGKSLSTVEDFLNARHYQPDATTVKPTPDAAVSSPQTNNAITSDPTSITVCDTSGKTHKVPPSTTGTLLSYFKANLPAETPPHECDGSVVCGTCAVEVVVPAPKPMTSPKEISLLKINKHNPSTHILACAHAATAEELKGGVFRFKK